MTAGKRTPRLRQDGVPRIDLDRGLCSTLDASINREWLVTNGIGGFAAGTVSGAATRRYHGLLVAALRPPGARTMLVAGLEAHAGYQGRDFALSTHEYADGTIDPDGFRHLEAFILNGGMPSWSFALGDARLGQSIWMDPGANTTCVHYRYERGSGPLVLRLAPLCTCRDFHGETRGGWIPGVRVTGDEVRIDAFEDATPYWLRCAEAGFEARTTWYWHFRHRLEAERGLDASEDLFTPGTFTVTLEPGASATLVCTAEPGGARSPGESLALDQRRRATRLLPVVREPGWVRQLALAADQFVVRRSGASAGEGEGATVIAGYPWFGDWGRDTMIALPGLTLATGRADLAALILRTFAGHLSDGLLPNRFADDGAQPEYNTADATLWYFHAVDACLRASGDEQLLRDLWPHLTGIIDWHLRGTRHGIGVDPADGLLRAGEAGMQLTWMDARVDGRVVTPRIGKPVEINALWHHALVVMGDCAARLDDAAAARAYRDHAKRARESFRQRFWFEAGGYLHDVVDTPEATEDPALRPNQIFAVSLPSPLLDGQQARSVVAACQRELLTPVGLRSLATTDPRYAGTCTGGPRERDTAYHQGTVWSWLLGPFARAHYRVHGNRAQAQSFLAGIGPHLAEACVGSVSEIFDGDAPHRPRGCFAQAWSVAEILAAWLELKDAS